MIVIEPSKLSAHSFKKGKFTTPLNSLPMMKEMENEKSWTYGRLPEYLWIGVILNKYGRQKGLEKIYYIINKLHELAPQIIIPRLSEILKLDKYVQEKFYEYIIDKTSKDIFTCLTLVFTYSKYKEFATMFCCPQISVEQRREELISVMQKIMGHQTNEATDIRFVVLYHFIISGKVHMPKEILDNILSYPELDHSAVEMRMIRPTIRATELSILELEVTDCDYLSQFWRCISEMTDCTLFAIKFPEEKADIP